MFCVKFGLTVRAYSVPLPDLKSYATNLNASFYKGMCHIKHMICNWGHKQPGGTNKIDPIIFAFSKHCETAVFRNPFLHPVIIRLCNYIDLHCNSIFYM